ncbi:MAG: hypothetical protein ACOY42_12265 [Pseudomonadota bacterium]|jgi:hypothetical protein
MKIESAQQWRHVALATSTHTRQAPWHQPTGATLTNFMKKDRGQAQDLHNFSPKIRRLRPFSQYGLLFGGRIDGTHPDSPCHPGAAAADPAGGRTPGF